MSSDRLRIINQLGFEHFDIVVWITLAAISLIKCYCCCYFCGNLSAIVICYALNAIPQLIIVCYAIHFCFAFRFVMTVVRFSPNALIKLKQLSFKTFHSKTNYCQQEERERKNPSSMNNAIEWNCTKIEIHCEIKNPKIYWTLRLPRFRSLSFCSCYLLVFENVKRWFRSILSCSPYIAVFFRTIYAKDLLVNDFFFLNHGRWICKRSHRIDELILSSAIVWNKLTRMKTTTKSTLHMDFFNQNLNVFKRAAATTPGTYLHITNEIGEETPLSIKSHYV